MIDKVKISNIIELDKRKFNKRFKLYKSRNVNKETGEIYIIDCYKAKLNNSISIIYSNITNKLKVEGRLININTIRNRIYNFDDYLKPRCKINSKSELMIEQSIDEIINKTNKELNNLLGIKRKKDKLNILDFKVEQLEVCFNIWLKSMLVNEYIELFNLIFINKNFKRYKNFTLEENKELYSSFYVKSKSAYDNNINTNYTVNFYNKLNQLEYLEKNTNLIITKDEKKRAQDLLRLEVQLYHYEIKRITGKVMNNKFGNFIDLELLLKILINKYEFFIGDSNLDFYSYKKAKEKILRSTVFTIKDKENLLNHIKERCKYNKKHSNSTVSKYNNMLKELGIHYYFIPTRWDIDYMKSPIKLLEQKLKYYLQEDNKYRSQEYYTISNKEYYTVANKEYYSE